MKKLVLVFASLTALAVILLCWTTQGGVHVGGMRILGDEDVRRVEELTLSFLEDVRYKDFRKAATYHREDERKSVDIASLLERIFVVKPEMLDILRYKISSIDIDSTRSRARSHCRVVIKVLNSSEIKEPDVIFFWFKDLREGWRMRLESSLR